MATSTTTNDPKSIQLFIKLPNTKTLTLEFPIHSPPTPQSLIHHLQTLTLIPPRFDPQTLTLTLNGRLLSDADPISRSLSVLSLSVPLLGGKGGFGSLLRGAVTKAGQKKTNNFDACRDMSGRRLRHVNAEKKLEEWKAEEEERRLEKKAEEWLKKEAKKRRKEGRDGDGEGGSAARYVEGYRVQSERCVKEVERSVRESVGELLVGKKRKKVMERLRGKGKENRDEKKLKIWMGKREMGDSESASDDSDDDQESEVREGEDGDVRNEKSMVIDGGSQSDFSKEDNGSIGSVSAVKLGRGREGYAGSPSKNGSEGEKDTGRVITDSDGSADGRERSSTVEPGKESVEQVKVVEEEKCGPADTVITTAPVPVEVASQCGGESVQEEVTEDNGAAEKANVPQSGNSGLELPLNFDNFSSASALEVLGMERLKSELQARGLKCGGTLQERAARLFLLKTTPIDKLPKKLLAKK